MPRQTNLSLMKLIDMLPGALGCDEETRDHELPKGCIVNEIGEIFWASGSDSPKAEQKLVEIMGGSSKELAWIAWKYLSDSKGPTRDQSALKAIAEYEARQ